MMSTTASTGCGPTLTSEELEELDEDAIVTLIRCRLAVLERAGCESADCLALASRADADLAKAAELIARGCPAELALRILV